MAVAPYRMAAVVRHKRRRHTSRPRKVRPYRACGAFGSSRTGSAFLPTESVAAVAAAYSSRRRSCTSTSRCRRLRAPPSSHQCKAETPAPAAGTYPRASSAHAGMAPVVAGSRSAASRRTPPSCHDPCLSCHLLTVCPSDHSHRTYLRGPCHDRSSRRCPISGPLEQPRCRRRPQSYTWMTVRPRPSRRRHCTPCVVRRRRIA